MDFVTRLILSGINGLKRFPPTLRIGLILVMVFLVGVLDYATRDQFDLSVLYLPLVALTVWVSGRRAGICIAVLSSVLWLIDDFVVPVRPLPTVSKYWQTVVRLAVFTSFAGVLAQLRTVLDREKAQARRDALTGLLNVRGFFEDAEVELARSRRSGRPLAAAFCDIDDFKLVNDELGHVVGNELLGAVGDTVRGCVRTTDLTARMGGDEFVVLFSETDARAAHCAVDKIRGRLSAEMAQRDWHVTFSFGLVVFAAAPDSVDDLIRAADDLMYEAKRSGKDTIRTLDLSGEMLGEPAAAAC